MSKRLDYVQGVEPLLDYVALGLRSPLQWRLVDFGLPRFPRQLQKTRPEGGRKRNRSARIMHIFVDQLVVLAYEQMQAGVNETGDAPADMIDHERAERPADG